MENNNSSSCINHFNKMAVVAIAFIAFVAFYIVPHQGAIVDENIHHLPLPSREFRTYNTTSYLKKEEWTPSTPLSPLMLETFPRVLKNTFLTEWKAFKTWDIENPEFREKIANKISNVYVNKLPVFGPLFREHKPMTQLPTVQWNNPFEKRTMSKDAFFNSLRNNTDPKTIKEYSYYTGDLSSPNLSRDLTPMSTPDDAPLPTENEPLTWRELIADPSSQVVSVWVGGSTNVTTSFHYDAQYNYFFQVRGKKRFLLVDSRDMDTCHLYPYLHPSFGQCQVHVHGKPSVEFRARSNPKMLQNDVRMQKTLFPRSQNMHVYEVTLVPGDVLVLPPYWGHQVQTISTSISINFWSDTPQQQIHDSSSKVLTLLFSTLSWSPAQRLAAVSYLLHRFFSHKALGDGMKFVDVDPEPIFRENSYYVVDGKNITEAEFKRNEDLRNSLVGSLFAANIQDENGLLDNLRKKMSRSNEVLPRSHAEDLRRFYEGYLEVRYSQLAKLRVFSLKPHTETVPPVDLAPSDTFIADSPFTTACGADVDLISKLNTKTYLKVRSLLIPSNSTDSEEPTLSNASIIQDLSSIADKVVEGFVEMHPDVRHVYLANLIETLVQQIDPEDKPARNAYGNLHCAVYLPTHI